MKTGQTKPKVNLNQFNTEIRKRNLNNVKSLYYHKTREEKQDFKIYLNIKSKEKQFSRSHESDMETKFQLRQIECNLKKTKNPVALKRFYRDNKLNLNTKSKSVDFNAVKTEYPPIKFVTQVSLASSKENQNLSQIYDLNSTIESGKTNLNPLDKEKIYKKLQREYSFVKNTNHTSSNVPLMYLSKSIRTNWNKNKSLLNSANDGLSREMKNSYSRTIIQLKSQGGSKLPSLNNSWRSVIENLNKMTTVRNLKLNSHFKIK